MEVYPTHRSASAPERIYEGTKRIATTATLVPDGNGVTGAVGGTPFPIPKSGLEVFWNHLRATAASPPRARWARCR